MCSPRGKVVDTEKKSEFALGYLLGCFKVPGLAYVQVMSWPPASLLQGDFLLQLPSKHNEVIKPRTFLMQNVP